MSAILLAGVFAAFTVSSSGTAAPSGAFTYSGTVTHVVDGDTLDVRVGSGKKLRVRVIGIDTPERGVCFFSQASSRTAALALGKKVTLRGDATQDTLDRYGRLLAYVDVNGSRDLGLELVRGGYAAVYVFRQPFQRLARYQVAATSAKTAKAGVHTACAITVAPTPPPVPTPSPPPASTTPATTTTQTTTAPVPFVPPTTTQAPTTNCHQNYTKCLPIVGDLDCADIRAMGKAPVQVIGADPYRLDGDNDGLGCE